MKEFLFYKLSFVCYDDVMGKSFRCFVFSTSNTAFTQTERTILWAFNPIFIYTLIFPAIAASPWRP